MFGLGVGEIAVILFIALVFIGPKKLPELAKGLGKGMRDFQNAMRGVTESVKDPMDQIREQIQSQANSQARGEFKDDPEHEQLKPEDEENILEPNSGQDCDHPEITEEELEKAAEERLANKDDKNPEQKS